jgi:anaerobic magnesium-protoporphyrin IX monomethyl ester cyclase
MRWYTRIGRRVWFHEVFEFIFRTRLLKNGPTLQEFMGNTLAAREYALAKARDPRPARLARLRATVSSG